MNYISKQRGFTLIELLVVISIIGTLSSVVTASVAQARQKAMNMFTVTSIKSYIDALRMYYLANGYYPPTDGTQGSGVCLGEPTSLTTGCFWSHVNTDNIFKNALQPYITSWANPSPGLVTEDITEPPASGAMFSCLSYNNGKCMTARIFWIKSISAPCIIPDAVYRSSYCYIDLL